MERSFKNIIILGKGSIGFYLYNYLIAKGFHEIKLISLRGIWEKFSDIIE